VSKLKGTRAQVKAVRYARSHPMDGRVAEWGKRVSAGAEIIKSVQGRFLQSMPYPYAVFDEAGLMIVHEGP
jgi:hypothetical protein